MHKLTLFLLTFCFLQNTFADTQPIHFDIGDIAPRQKISFDINLLQSPGYHTISCDIIDPSSAAIIKIASNDSSAEIVQINQIKHDYRFFNQLPPLLSLQVGLTTQQNKLILFGTLNTTNEIPNTITFQNLDDDVTISIKNCNLSPTATLSKELIYFPSTIICSAHHCDTQGGSPSENWKLVTPAPDGTYYYSNAQYSNNAPFGTYYSTTTSGSLSLTTINNTKPYVDIYTSWGDADEQGNRWCNIGGVPNVCPLQNN